MMFTSLGFYSKGCVLSVNVSEEEEEQQGGVYTGTLNSYEQC